MADWLASMQQTFEYYTVDPGTWKDVKLIRTITSSTVNRDSEAETLGSATLDSTESVGECYIRIYLVTIQNGVTERHPLGTFLVQAPSMSFDGRIHGATLDAYTPLMELKEDYPPLGYSILEGANIMDNAYAITKEHVRAPVIKSSSDKTLFNDFVADPDEKWLSFTRDLIANAKYEYALDELGRILFAPKQETDSLQPVWTYDDGNSSILYPDITLDNDLFDVPNVVEVIYSSASGHYYAKVVNDDPNSPTSTINRGREIKRRVTDPDMIGDPTGDQIQEYAEQLLKELSSIETTVTYTHGYCPVRLGDCVRLNFSRPGWSNIKARVINQSIKCDLGCQVTEKAVCTIKLWG